MSVQQEKESRECISFDVTNINIIFYKSLSSYPFDTSKQILVSTTRFKRYCITPHFSHYRGMRKAAMFYNTYIPPAEHFKSADLLPKKAVLCANDNYL